MGMERGDCGTAGRLLNRASSPAIHLFLTEDKDAHKRQLCHMHMLCVCVCVAGVLSHRLPALFFFLLRPKRKDCSIISKTRPHMTRLETLVSCLGRRHPSAASLQDTKNYPVWHNQTYLQAERLLVPVQPFMCHFTRFTQDSQAAPLASGLVSQSHPTVRIKAAVLCFCKPMKTYNTNILFWGKSWTAPWERRSRD